MRIFKALLMCALILAVASCDSDESKLKKLIPADASAVIRIDLNGIIEKAGMMDGDGKIAVPDSTLDIAAMHPDNMVARIVSLLPSGGIDVECPIFIFYDNRSMPVALIKAKDIHLLEDDISTMAGDNFVDYNNKGVRHLRDKDFSYALQDEVLVLRIVPANAPYEADMPSNYYQSLKTSPKLFDEEEQISEFLENGSDVNAYIKAKCVDECFPLTNPLFLTLLRGHDFDALKMSLNIDMPKMIATLTTSIDSPNGSNYNQLATTVLSRPSCAFLDVVPESMETVISLSVDGELALQLPQVKTALSLLAGTPLKQLDVTSLLREVDGPLAFAFAQDPFFNDYNMVIAAQAKHPQVMVDTISAFASALGQDPLIVRGEHIYEYENKQVSVGVRDNVFYLKAISYDDSGESPLSQMPDATELFNKSIFAVYTPAKIGDEVVGFFTYGMNDHKNGEGLFYTVDNADNLALTLIELLCTVPTRAAVMGQPEK